MPRKTQKFLIGLFVSAGFLLGAIAVIWLGSTRYFKKSYVYVTYFDESVQGLQVDSAVRYRGVDVGRVKQIKVAPDDRLIEVLMNIYKKEVIRTDTMARLALAGLSGSAFINLAPGTPEELKLSPRPTFPLRYPLIPSRPSEIREIESGAGAFMEKLAQLDLKGVSDQLKMTAQSMQRFLTDRRMNAVMANLESTTAKLNVTIGKVEKILAEGKIEGILTQTRDTLVEAHALIDRVQNELQNMKLTETAGKANRLVGDLDKRTRAIADQMQTTSQNLQQASETLDRLLKRLYSSPSDIIWSKPPPVRRKE